MTRKEEFEQHIITMAEDFIEMDGHIATINIDTASDYISDELGLRKEMVEKVLEQEYKKVS